MSTWIARQLQRNVFQVRTLVKKNKDWSFWVLLTSDRHWDNPKSNHKLQLAHMKEAKELGAPIIDMGDFLCLMQGKWDRRSSKSSLRPEHRCDNYLDAVVETATDFFAPYAGQFVTIGVGNHEASIQDRYETSMTDRLVGALNYKTGSHIHVGGFSGWVIFSFSEGNGSKSLGRIVLHYDHGYGGGGPVTADMIQHNRRSVYLPDADIIVSGHTHDQWTRNVAVLRLANNGKVTQAKQAHIKIPTYKDDYGDGFKFTWPTGKKGMPPKPIGAYWLKFSFRRDPKSIVYQVIEAI